MKTPRKDYYKLLGIERRADWKAIKSAYRRSALRYHPDVARGKRAADRFREIHEAYTVLSDPERRARYDAMWAADQTRSKHMDLPKRGDVSTGTVRSYSFNLGGLGVRLRFGWGRVAARGRHTGRAEPGGGQRHRRRAKRSD